LQGHRARYGWSAAEEVPVKPKVAATYGGHGPVPGDESRLATESHAKSRPLGSDAAYAREGELMSKLHDLLHSPFGDCITGIVDDLHRVLCQVRNVG
jgi:hypothetical protein